jgi:hypothetical protein
VCRNQGTGHYGQNIDAAGMSVPVSNWSPSSVVAYSITDSWYNSEAPNFVPFYTVPSPSSSQEFLHFTQIVWKGTQSVGCHSQYCGLDTVVGGGEYGWFTVCNYSPQGKALASSFEFHS